MDRDELLATVSRLLEAETSELTCEQPGHRDGHTCVPVSDNDIDPSDAFDSRYPVMYWNGEPPMALPQGHVWDGAWAHGMRAVAVGADADIRLVVAVARRTIPEPVALPARMSWVERLVAITGGPSSPVPSPDWAAVESRLGTPLPNDYRRLVETFGCDGMFNGFFDVFTPERLIRDTKVHAARDMRFGEEHPPFPAPGGLIPWSNNEHEETHFWITDGPDPDRWPVYAVDSLDEGSRFECTATEFLFRQMTDQEHPFHIAAENVRGHWFQHVPPKP
ncbi:SMI1/KNR4 family protein [Spirillospora sp. NPDC047279]|uniref:SMI1/KNR4 family protein n=1 Tax=Spirillospora sp. NPDC047279 TaxID=3155478 RepID=UPI0034087BB4